MTEKQDLRFVKRTGRLEESNGENNEPAGT